MFSKPVAVGVLALACVSAAAGGAYVAGRHNGPESTALAAAPAAAGQSTPAQPAPVHETEAVIAPPSQPSAPADAASPAAAPEKTIPVERPAARPAARAVRPAEPPRRSPARTTSAAPAAPRVADSAAPGPVAPPPMRPEPIGTTARTDVPAAEPLPVEPPRAEPPPPPARIFDELVIPSSSVVGLQIETPVSSERARVEDRVEARVVRDITVDGRTAIPAGARAIGAVTLVDRGGKMKERARLGVRFHTLVLADGSELPMRSDTIYRDGESPAGDSARKIGGAAVGGAILGAIIGGKKGAVIGGATGAAGGSAVVMAGDRNAATLPVGAVVTVRLAAPVSVEVERR